MTGVPEKETPVLPELMTASEVAAYLRVPVQTLYTWRVDARGPRGARVGRHLRYRRSEVERWLDTQGAG